MSASVPPTSGPGAAPTPAGAPADPSMEDILASIRRILSEDEQPASGADAQPPAEAADVLALDESMLVPTPASPPQPVPPPPAQSADDDMDALIAAMSTPSEPLETEPVPPEEPAPPAAVAAPPVPAPLPIALPLAAPDADRLIAPEVEAKATSSVSSLLRTIEAGREQAANLPVYRGGPTLEDMVREEIRPLLKSWLDDHLPPLVERLVRAEIERLVGRAVS